MSTANAPGRMSMLMKEQTYRNITSKNVQRGLIGIATGFSFTVMRCKSSCHAADRNC